MNYKELDMVLSTLLSDSSYNFYTKDERTMALNTACNYINGELQLLRNVAQITVTPTDLGRVALPGDFVSIGQGVSWLSQQGTKVALSYRSPLEAHLNSVDWDTVLGEPEYYVFEGGNLYITPMPTTAGTLVLPYIAMPNKLLADTDIPFYGDVRTQSYHEMIAYYAAWQLCLKDRDFEAAGQYMQYFQARMIDLKENLRHTGGLVQPVWSDTYSTA